MLLIAVYERECFRIRVKILRLYPDPQKVNTDPHTANNFTCDDFSGIIYIAYYRPDLKADLRLSRAYCLYLSFLGATRAYKQAAV